MRRLALTLTGVKGLAQGHELLAGSWALLPPGSLVPEPSGSVEHPRTPGPVSGHLGAQGVSGEELRALGRRMGKASCQSKDSASPRSAPGPWDKGPWPKSAIL